MTTVAIIDDDTIFQFATKKLIQHTNKATKIISFFDGQKALDFFNSNIENNDILPDIIFLDLNMPITDGWQFLEQYGQIRAQIQKKILIYVVSSSQNPDDIILLKNINSVAEYIVKPLILDKIKQVLTPNLQST